MRSLRGLVLLLLALATSARAAPAAWDRPASRIQQRRALTGVLRRVYLAARRGERPVVVVDIDDTVSDGRLRLRTAAGGAGLPTTNLTSAEDLYAGLSGPVLETRRAAFNKLYFHDPRLAGLDTAQRGAADFLRAVQHAGGRVLYVSGRWESTRAATVTHLRAIGLPDVAPEDLLLNPSETQPASDWKRRAKQRIVAAGKTVALFDNEAESAAAYRAGFPGARVFRLATFRFHPAPAAPPRGVTIVRDFALAP